MGGTISHEIPSSETQLVDWSEVTLGELLYPIIMFVLGSVFLRRSATRIHMREHALWVEHRNDPEERRRRIATLTWKNKACILSYQVCMALAFEGLFDKVFEQMEEEQEFVTYLLPVGVTLMWVFVGCATTKLLPHEEWEEEEEEEDDTDKGLPLNALPL